jgi:hypothetical protein
MTEHAIFSDDSGNISAIAFSILSSVAALLLTASRVVAIVSEEIE